MTDPTVIDYKGKLYYTGNLACPPAKRRLRAPIFPQKKILTKTEIIDILRDPKRLPARREFSPSMIYGQGNASSCCGCAAAKAYERAEIRTGRQWTRRSGEYIYSHINGGRDQGAMLDDSIEHLQKRGVCEWKPDHFQVWRKSHFKPEEHRDAVKNLALEFYSVNTELAFASALAQQFTIVTAVEASQAFMRLDRRGIAGFSPGPANHAVGCDDAKVDDGDLLYDMFNSWTTDYGDNGRAYLTWQHMAEPSKYHFLYAIRCVTRSPDSGVPGLKTS